MLLGFNKKKRRGYMIKAFLPFFILGPYNTYFMWLISRTTSKLPTRIDTILGKPPQFIFFFKFDLHLYICNPGSQVNTLNFSLLSVF